MAKVSKLLASILTLLLISTNVKASPSESSLFALEKLNEWNNKLSQKGVLEHGMTIDPKFTEIKDLNKWLGIDKRYNGKDKLFKFGKDSYGSILYLWYYPELKGEPPVVTSDLSDYSADSVAENMTDYVCGLIQGGEDVYNKKYSNLAEVEEYKKQLTKSLTCKVKPKIFFGLKKHPKFNEWLDKLDNKKMETQIFKKIDALAQVIFKDDYSYWLKEIATLKKSATNIFTDDMEIQNPFGSKHSVDALPFEYYFLFFSNEHYDKMKNRLEMIDWSGEYEENQFSNYVTHRLKTYGKTDFSLDEWFSLSGKILADPTLERGDYIIKQFEYFSKALRLQGFFLLMIDEGSDQYYPFVVNQEEYLQWVNTKIGVLEIEETFW